METLQTAYLLNTIVVLLFLFVGVVWFQHFKKRRKLDQEESAHAARILKKYL